MAVVHRVVADDAEIQRIAAIRRRRRQARDNAIRSSSSEYGSGSISRSLHLAA